LFVGYIYMGLLRWASLKIKSKLREFGWNSIIYCKDYNFRLWSYAAVNFSEQDMSETHLAWNKKRPREYNFYRVGLIRLLIVSCMVVKFAKLH